MPKDTTSKKTEENIQGTDISMDNRTNGDCGYMKSMIIKRYEKHYKKYPFLKDRIEKWFEDFWKNYVKVYKDQPGQEKAITEIFDSILDSLNDRPARLHKLDKERELEPDWFKSHKLVGGMLYVDLFAGNLKNLYKIIPYLNELGINYLHLMPMLKPREGLNDGGYAVQDFRNVDPRLGTYDELRKLSRMLHDAGINLVFDFVMNHTAKEHRWAQLAMAGDERYQLYYHMYDDRNLPNEYEKHLVEVFPDFSPGNFSYFPQIDKWVWTTFYEFQWDLNYSNPQLFQAMLEEMMHLANMGVDFFRLDAVPYIWKRLGTHCQNQEEAHFIIRAYRALMRIAAPSVLFKAEAIVGPEEIIKYLGTGGYEGKECEIAYNATLMNHLWHALACNNTHLLRTTLYNLPRAPQHTAWVNYLRSHDDIGWGITEENAAKVLQNGHNTRMFCTNFYTGKIHGSFAEGYPFQRDYWSGEARVSGTLAALAGLQKAMVEAEELEIEDSVRRILLLQNVVFTWKGIPLIYMGDELGQMNDLSYLGDFTKRGDNRWVHRPTMNWNKAELRKMEGTMENKLFRGMQKLVDARKDIPTLNGNSVDRIFLINRDSAFVFEREYEGERILFISNFLNEPIHIPKHMLPESWRLPYYRELFKNRVMNFSFEEIVLEPYGFIWLTPTELKTSDRAELTIIDVLAETEYGEEIHILGNLPQLGGWDPEKTVGPLSAESYPNWELQIALPANTYFEFQWIKKRNGQIIEWSPDKYWMKSGDEVSYH
ncbi:MAG: alpha-amylase family glycosyl hydrolase [Balneolales bacterium]